MKYILTIDFGSTFTKVSAVDVLNEKILGYAKSFTTIETDVREGLENALKNLNQVCGKIEFDKKLASSSAAGGLKMISCGLVPELTAKASKMAASSAGAKVLKTFSYELSLLEKEEIEYLNPDIILLCGGIDGGNKDVILHNAKVLSETKGVFSVIVAGNKSVSSEVCEILKKNGKNAILTENVMPEFNKLNIGPAKAKIRDLFIENIIEAKGLSKVQEILDDKIVPTPLAVFEAAELLSLGIEGYTQGFGEVMCVDVGGATTDVYSMTAGEPTKSNVVLRGLKEPFAKRSVEGDIGIRYSISSLAEEAGYEKLSQKLNISEEVILNWVEKCKKTPDIIPNMDSLEKKIDEELAASAVEISVNRHAGYFETVYTPVGEMYMQTGKDLSNVKYVIGTGGSVINSLDPVEILKRSMYNPAEFTHLKPTSPKLLLDRKNVIAAMGLLGRADKRAAFGIMKKVFEEL